MTTLGMDDIRVLQRYCIQNLPVPSRDPSSMHVLIDRLSDAETRDQLRDIERRHVQALDAIAPGDRDVEHGINEGGDEFDPLCRICLSRICLSRFHCWNRLPYVCVFVCLCVCVCVVCLDATWRKSPRII